MQKILSSKPVLTADYFTVNEMQVMLGNKKVVTHHMVDTNQIAAILPLSEKNEIYLVSEYRYMLGKTVLGIIAGNMNKNETSLEAAKRELEEETGLRASQWEEVLRLENARSSVRQTVHIFLAKGLEMLAQRPDEDEEITVIKVPLAEAVKKIFTGEIYHSASVAGILYLDKLRQEKRL